MMDMLRGRAISRYSSSDHVIGHSVIAALLRVTQFASLDDAAGTPHLHQALAPG